MAQLSPPFILCPLSEPKDLLGLSAENVDLSSVILTLGKNIAIRYLVTEQKQEISWSSSRHWFTSPVIYVPELQKLGAVFDHSIIGLWDEADTYLGSLKKHRFQEQLFELKSTKFHGVLGIFKNGHVEPLTLLTKSKNTMQTKRPGIPDVGESYKLISTAVDENDGHVFLLFGVPVDTQDSGKVNVKGRAKTSSTSGTHKLSSLKVFTIKLNSSFHNEVVHVAEVQSISLGYCVVTNGSNSFLVYFGPDGMLLRKPLISSAPEDLQTTTSLSNISKYLSTENPAVIKPHDPSTIIIYGCDSSEEGAAVLVYDITYDLLLSKQSLKLYSSPPIMDKIGPNIFVPVGLHMLVLNLKITKSLLSSMVGRHRLISTECFESNEPWKEWEIEEGGTATTFVDSTKPEPPVSLSETVQLIKTLEGGGQPQSAICTQIIPQIIDLHDLSTLKWTLNYFQDIPESHLVLLLDALFQYYTDEDENNPQEQIYEIFQRKFDQKLMTRNLRSLPFQRTKEILTFLLKSLDNIWELHLEPDVEQVSQLLKWLSILLDSHYAQFVIHEETELITRLLKHIDHKADLMEEIETLEPILLTTLTKVSFEPGPSPNSKYRRELITFE